MHFGEQYGGGSLKTKNRVTKDPAIPLLGRYLEKKKLQKDTPSPQQHYLQQPGNGSNLDV